MKKLAILSLVLLPFLAKAETIWRIDEVVVCGGDWKYAGCTAASLSVDIGVWPVAWGHSVNVVYTHDGWRTVKVKSANWVTNFNNPYGGQDEKWRVELPIGYTSMGGQLQPVEYAIWVTNGAGQSYWDNNRGWNYYFPGGGSDLIEIW